MRAPEFWHRPGSAWADLLAPLGALYDAAGAVRNAFARPVRLPVPVICVGNVTAGGAGKTPVALALAAWLKVRGKHPHFLTRGYGGGAAGPLRVEPAHHSFRDVGDEALLLAAAAPTWLAHDRVAGGRAAFAAGADCIVMDDGFQNPALAKDVSLLVVDGGYGFGNGRVMPAGPLRESVARAIARSQGVVLIGEDEFGVGAKLQSRLPVLAARMVPDPDSAAIAGKRVLAFAGIGRPEKFFASLRALGCVLVERVSFADHHAYRDAEIDELIEDAAAQDTIPVTTEKDLVRLPPDARARVKALSVAIAWSDEGALAHLLETALHRPMDKGHG